MNQKRFPIISDDEIMLSEMPAMNLYDESDFISNIKGDYQDKNYLEWSPIIKDKPSNQQHNRQVSEKTEKSYAELAREEARADLKKKRSASYLTQDITHVRRHKSSKIAKPSKRPTAPFQKENPGEYTKYSKKLTQSHYILAENIVQIQKSSKEDNLGSKKNNFDFLKKSQIYNKKENQTEKERKVAQELNLTNITE